MKLPNIMEQPRTLELIREALREDIGAGDVTSLALVPASASVTAEIISRGNYLISGATVAKAVFLAVDGRLRCTTLIPDGRRAGPGQSIARIRGCARSILTAERTALNFAQRMTGIATLTGRFVEEVKPYRTMILDTRKTTPGLRALEKYAVLCGGGCNHRIGLHDRFLIKDNHRRLWRRGGKARLDEAVAVCRRRFPGLAVEVEVESARELESALKGRPEWVLLDNMSPAALKRCVALCRGRAKLEASGGIALANVRAVAASGVDAVSLGCLTHSAPAADLSLEITRP
jgi:nicotinate-nucleotide pyrophosphorylase (carboxylating)